MSYRDDVFVEFPCSIEDRSPRVELRRDGFFLKQDFLTRTYSVGFTTHELIDTVIVTDLPLDLAQQRFMAAIGAMDSLRFLSLSAAIEEHNIASTS